ncbi:MAG TPA: hypothetical protein VLS93_06855 [Anaeromyxobacteraceae bacterium]|nr:hypothetical protein [Anaeromyxobacteraceae bacterium]
MNAGLPEIVLDAFPTATFVADADLNVAHLNAAARTLVGPPRPGARAGDLLGCALAADGGCGASAGCAACPLRAAASAALGSSTAVRRRIVLDLAVAGGSEPVPLLVGAAPAGPGSGLVVLALEDVTELTALRALWSSMCTGAMRMRPAAADPRH